MTGLKLMAVAVHRQRLGFVYFVGGKLKNWETQTKASKSVSLAAEALQTAINAFKPNVIVTEKTGEGFCKGVRVRAITDALQRTAAENYVLDVSVTRDLGFSTLFEQTELLAELYPDLAPWRPPKRGFFDNERHRTVLFDALALAHKVLQSPTATLAAAMD
jgi:hypothetical protein